MLRSPVFIAPKAPVNQQKSLLVIAMLTALLPPIGLVCVWRSSRCSMVSKAALSALGVVSLSIMFFFALRIEPIHTNVEVPFAPENMSATATADPAAQQLTQPAPPSDDVSATETVPAAEETPTESEALPDTPDGVVPANPAG